MTEQQRQEEREAEELYRAKAAARNEAYQSFSAEERQVYSRVHDALAAAESRAVNA